MKWYDAINWMRSFPFPWCLFIQPARIPPPRAPGIEECGCVSPCIPQVRRKCDLPPRVQSVNCSIKKRSHVGWSGPADVGIEGRRPVLDAGRHLERVPQRQTQDPLASPASSMGYLRSMIRPRLSSARHVELQPYSDWSVVQTIPGATFSELDDSKRRGSPLCLHSFLCGLR